MKYVILFFSLLIGSVVYAQDSTAVEEIHTVATTNKIGEDCTLCTELDLLPYISGGYYVSLWYGKYHLRYRGVYANTNLPSLAVPEGFKNH